jgi:hypothetical protein
VLGQGRTRALAASLVNANELLIRARAVFDRLVAVWWDDLAGVAWRLYPSEGVHVPGPTFGHIDVDLKSQIRQAVRAAVVPPANCVVETRLQLDVLPVAVAELAAEMDPLCELIMHTCAAVRVGEALASGSEKRRTSWRCQEGAQRRRF